MNAWLFRVARVMHPYRGHGEIVATLAAAVAGQAVAYGEIERAVRNSKEAAWNPEATNTSDKAENMASGQSGTTRGHHSHRRRSL